MAKMKSDAPLDYAVFQLSPKRSRCELFVSSDGSTEKLASGLLKPFVAHLKVAEEQVASAAQLVKLQVGRGKNAEVWFTKGTLERFVRFVSTPEILELVNTYDAEMSQLEAARRIYSQVCISVSSNCSNGSAVSGAWLKYISHEFQGARDQLSGGGGSGVTAAEDATKKELLRAIDVRLVAVQQDLSAACARAAAADFNIDSVSELQMFADRFGAHRLNEACGKFISLCERRPYIINPLKPGREDRALRSSCGSDMSIDDDPPSPPPCPEPATCQQPNPPSITFPLRRTFSRESSVERDDRNKPNDAVQEKDKEDETSIPEETPPLQTSQLSRRLSVQDRVKLFENKQKENSGGKPVVVKSVELRRMSSDVASMGAAAAEKAVLRRWSGVSDMSIDLSAEKKDTESPLDTPSSATVSQENKLLNLNDDAAKSSSIKPEIKIIPSLGRIGDSGLKEGQFLESSKSNSILVPGDNDGLKDQERGKTQSMSFISKSDYQENSEEKMKGSYSGQELSGPQSQIAGVKDQSSSLTQIRPFGSKGGQVKISNQREDTFAGSRIQEAFAARYKGIEVDSSSAQQDVRSVRETEVVEKKVSRASEKVSSGFVSSSEDFGAQGMKFNRQGSAAEVSKKAKVKQDESCLSGNRRSPYSGKVITEAQQGYDSFSTPPPEQSQRVRQSKGNQELNDELKMKANELEKLFAEHKLRLPGDQSNSARKETVSDISPQVSDNYESTDLIGSSKNKTKSNAVPLMKTIDSQNYGDALNMKFSELGISEGSRGKLYDKYMQKRDAKLREDWSSNGAKKEAKLKSLQDSLERSRSKMKATFSGSADRQDSVSSARRRAERLRSYNSRSIMKREQQHLEFGDSEDDEEALDFLEKDRPREDRALDDTSIGDGISRGAQGKKLLPNNRNSSSSTPRTTAAPVPKSATKTSTITSGKRRMPPENPLTQSVPNFSDMRKENTKPSKTSRLQVRNYARSKSTSDEATIVKEDRSRQAQTSRKNSANLNKSREMSPLDSDGVASTPIKIDEEVIKNVGTKTFLRKGSRASFVAQASISRQKVASLGSEPVNTVEQSDDFAHGPDEFDGPIKDEVDEEFEDFNTEVKMESDKYVNSESENGDVTPIFSRLDQALGSQLPTEIPSSFLPVDSMQDWQGESPTSWNSRTQHPFSSYPTEMSDVDASVDSPVGSPISWNSHSLNQMESDAARMRKKWGTAQKPTLAAHTSNNNSSRKDMTRGFKRLLKFGRKSRGSESLVDWISATTSEGDDDTEDGRDISNRSSEDLRKSRMGFSQAQPSEFSFNESEYFNESAIPAPPANYKLRDDHMSGSSIKAPRSFFSLSTFRSKGSDSKPR
ncbi:hypothetical protein BUALT_Bualt07G0168600 [Buddleja alternifolia]|uniref:COP1-interacting protein 7 n=1 Tax=Buddleja alternifolia TaxID=168488 RepID=A0AAV6XCM8_9LAMI|nr:hypothetical protein BUALT_Bualt07G0168600 [Buddleja alternifolia]